jgi:hypothetical protein
MAHPGYYQAQHDEVAPPLMGEVDAEAHQQKAPASNPQADDATPGTGFPHHQNGRCHEKDQRKRSERGPHEGERCGRTQADLGLIS